MRNIKKNDSKDNNNIAKDTLCSISPVTSAKRFSSVGRRKYLHPDLYKLIIENIKHDRKAQKITQRELAKRLRTVPSWVAKIETGERRMDLIEMLDIYTSIEVDPLPRIDEILQKIIHKKSFDKK